MKQDYTDIIIVLDRSGSMESIKSDTIGGLNRFIADQKTAHGEAKLTLSQFDHEYEELVKASPIGEVKLITAENYVPRGWTALHGAIGRAISDAGWRFSAMPEADRPEQVVFVIITDGLENSSPKYEWSKAYTAARIKEMIDHQTNAYKWQFVYIGANQDAVMAANDLGISTNNAMNYTSNAVGTQALYVDLSANVRSFREKISKDMSWKAGQLRKQAEAKKVKIRRWERYWLFAAVAMLVPFCISLITHDIAEAFVSIALSFNWMLMWFAARNVRLERERLNYILNAPSEFFNLSQR